ncbi:uncharacterized protein [Rutidosis leptorrhynchoides]|uniref:uncharacterized protein n=1 Tax=Rutidosis leptorrhynchoides TaxID=125765 RepID=UPI003A9923A8
MSSFSNVEFGRYILHFEEGEVPARYLDHARNKISDWKNKFLSFEGKVQLFSTVLTTRRLYWQSTFIVPIAIVKEIEGLMRGFLWCLGDMKWGKAKLEWSRACLSKEEGGLGIKKLKEWNITLMVKWEHTYRLEGRSFWDAPLVNGASVSWCNIIAISGTIRDRFVYCIDNGAFVSTWLDTWSDYGPLATIISNRDIFHAGFSREAKLSDIVAQNGWRWPSTWFGKYSGQTQLIGIVLYGFHNASRDIHCSWYDCRLVKTKNRLMVMKKVLLSITNSITESNGVGFCGDGYGDHGFHLTVHEQGS